VPGPQSGEPATTPWDPGLSSPPIYTECSSPKPGRGPRLNRLPAAMAFVAAFQGLLTSEQGLTAVTSPLRDASVWTSVGIRQHQGPEVAESFAARSAPLAARMTIAAAGSPNPTAQSPTDRGKRARAGHGHQDSGADRTHPPEHNANPHAECSACHTAPAGETNALTPGRFPGRASKDARGRDGRKAGNNDAAGGTAPVVPLEACFGCHFDPRSVGTNGIGDAAVHYGVPRNPTGHGLLCQDCHTFRDMHAGLSTEVRCEDCHGTPDKSPWELPLATGRGGEPESVGPARGFARKRIAKGDRSAQGVRHLVTSLGNAFGNVVLRGKHVWLYSASGEEHEVTQLKWLNERQSWRSQLSRQVKSTPDLHDNMGCLDCHADSLPPCLSCHAKDAGATTDGGHLRNE
jgi:hypothetical protein